GLPEIAAPLFERERRVRDDTVEREKTTGARIGECGTTERVFSCDLKVLDAVQHEVHARDRRGRQVLFLTVDLAKEGAGVTVFPPNMLDRSEEHAAGAAGRVINRLTFFRIED